SCFVCSHSPCLLPQFYMILFFFFSSRRRHTRSKRDWSSDVCSSDLSSPFLSVASSSSPANSAAGLGASLGAGTGAAAAATGAELGGAPAVTSTGSSTRAFSVGAYGSRSEERRVGKERGGAGRGCEYI